MQSLGRLDEACTEISRSLLEYESPTSADVRAEIRKACVRYSLKKIPKNREILAAAGGDGFERLRHLLLKKPVKTASGVAVIAVMPMPYACPHGRCTYCPGGKASNTPNSYTGGEPIAAGAMNSGYDPGSQVRAGLARLRAHGHDAAKLEIVIVGGTFLFMPQEYQEWFVKSCYDALNGSASSGIEDAKHLNETAAHRNVGLTIETKPDYCKRVHVDAMLGFGATRVEIGVQSLQEEVYKRVNRGHNYQDVVESFAAAKDAGYKVAAHMMPGLPGATPEGDIEDMRMLFEDPALRPDMLKIYPALVVRGTPMYDEYARGEYSPYTEEEAVRVLSEAKARVPRWARIMRVQREIHPDEIVAGPKSGNLRQLVHKRLQEQGRRCRCIRCREAGLAGRTGPRDLRIDRADYAASGGTESFISLVDNDDAVYGFVRMRRPSIEAHRPEVSPESCIIRELHVYGRSLGLGERGGIQHSGLGRRLVSEAESVSAEFGAKRLLVISAVGTRGYYSRLGYSRRGPYMEKIL
ncbi:histone acetyltransferase [Cenarchaeum symbiosum A]|uniref:tRNA carboxymethyluridine synthase n=1 Tax=Cenarchaeum symbiosum (strain A) TaxID=414004 RepID=A0RWR6_CENSY|nr:histone acetyltransferase [Cenarchaeum symbiosum A]